MPETQAAIIARRSIIFTIVKDSLLEMLQVRSLVPDLNAHHCPPAAFILQLGCGEIHEVQPRETVASASQQLFKQLYNVMNTGPPTSSENNLFSYHDINVS